MNAHQGEAARPEIWIVVDADGAPDLRCARPDPQQAIQAFLSTAADAAAASRTWPEWEEDGFSCRSFRLSEALKRHSNGQEERARSHGDR